MSTNKDIEHVLVKGLTNMLKRSLEVDYRSKLAIAQEYKEWINCNSASDFSKQEILVIDKNIFR